jgi:hypothetical protein
VDGIEAYREALSLLPDEEPGDADLDELDPGNDRQLSDEEMAEVQVRLEQVRAEKLAAVARGDLGEVERAKQTKRGVFWAEPKYPKRKREPEMSAASHWAEKRKADAERLFQIERAHPLASPAKLCALFEQQTGKQINATRFRQIYEEAGRPIPAGRDDDSDEEETPKHPWRKYPKEPKALAAPQAENRSNGHSSAGTGLAAATRVTLKPRPDDSSAWQPESLAGIKVELAAMVEVVEVLGRLDDATACRVLDWLRDRLGSNGDSSLSV